MSDQMTPSWDGLLCYERDLLRLARIVGNRGDGAREFVEELKERGERRKTESGRTERPIDKDRTDPHWAVTVYRDGDEVLTIAHNHLSGRDLDRLDEKIIRRAARHLLAFVGDNSDD